MTRAWALPIQSNRWCNWDSVTTRYMRSVRQFVVKTMFLRKVRGCIVPLGVVEWDVGKDNLYIIASIIVFGERNRIFDDGDASLNI